MSDDLTQRGGSDRLRINLHQEHEVRDWADKFGVSQQQLRDAIRAVGDRADRVQEHLWTHASNASSSGENVR